MDVSCPAENGGGGATTGWYRVIHTRCCDPVCASELFTYIYIYTHTCVCERADYEIPARLHKRRFSLTRCACIIEEKSHISRIAESEGGARRI